MPYGAYELKGLGFIPRPGGLFAQIFDSIRPANLKSTNND